jgi:anaerobic selenocysteine-containing dehydrogenase
VEAADAAPEAPTHEQVTSGSGSRPALLPYAATAVGEAPAVDAPTAEIAARAPAYAGHIPEVLAGPASHDGIVVPADPDALQAAVAGSQMPAGAGDADGEHHQAADPSGAPEHMQGVAEPGSHETEDTSEAATEPAAAVEAADAAPEAPTHEQVTSGSGSRPALLTYAATAVGEAPAVDAYSLRLVATRKLYDQGTALQHSPSLAGLAPGPSLRLHPHDFDRVGVAAGTVVNVTSSSGSVQLPVFADDGVPRGTAAVVLRQAGGEVTALIDATARVIDVRVLP